MQCKSCDHPGIAHGMCKRLYEATKRAGLLPPRPTLIDRLKKLGESNYVTGCIEWIGSRGRKGYGQIDVKGRSLKAHRVAWEVANGPIPPGMQVLHKCDNPSCINPNHLFLGTNGDNVADKCAKHRQARQKGELNGFAKLTEAEVREIREDKRLLREVAFDYGIGKSNVSRIRHGVSWKHVA